MDYLVIPAYEPDEKLLTLLKNIEQYSEFQIIIVDDGSSEKCKELLKSAGRYGTVLRHRTNQGKGRALKTAFSYLQTQGGGGFVVTADADGQHTPEDIRRVLTMSRKNPRALVVGSRRFIGRVPLKSRVVGNALTRHFFSFATSLCLHDTQSGLRGFSKSLLPLLCSIRGERYEYETNVLLTCADRLPILELPIDTVYLDGNRSSHFRPFKDGILIYKDILKFTLSSFVGFLTDYAAYALLLSLFSFLPAGTRLVLSNVSARVLSSTVNFLLNKKVVFHDKGNVLKTGIEYFLLAAVILAFDTLGIGALNSLGFHNLYLAKILVDTLLFFLNWLIQRKLIFKEK